MSACKCCERYAPGPINGDERPPCQGIKDIKQARDLAKLWYQRAMEAGWEKPPKCCDCDGPLVPCKEVHGHYCPKCVEAEREAGEVAAMTAAGVNASTVPASPPTRGQPEDKEHRAGECRGQAWFACRTCNPRGSKQYRHCENGCAVPSTPDSDVCLPCKDKIEVKLWGKPCRCEELDKAKREPGTECSHCPRRKPAVIVQDWPEVADGLDRAMDAEIAKAEARKGHPGQEKLVAEHLEEAIEAGMAIAYCQGKERHHCIVGSKLHEQMLERGCIQCGAYPEDPA